MWRSPNPGQGMWVQDMNKGESMKEIMDQELAEAIRLLEKANTAFERIFGIEQEGESE